MSDFIRIAYTFIPAISPCWMPLPHCRTLRKMLMNFLRPGEPRRHPFLMGELKMSNDQDNKKRHHQHGNGVFIASLVYSIIPYLYQKVQENRYFTSFLPVIHSILCVVDNCNYLIDCSYHSSGLQSVIICS